MFFPDLTQYEYGGEEPHRNVLNVGWLSRNHVFPTGSVPGRVVNALRRLVASPVNLYRGSHRCEFCMDLGSSASPTPMGNGEIRVAGAEGRVYVAPVLVVHYVEAHHYRPPAEFMRAALAAGAHTQEEERDRTPLMTRRQGADHQASPSSPGREGLGGRSRRFPRERSPGADRS